MSRLRAKFAIPLAIGITILVALAFLSRTLLVLQVLKVQGREMEPTIRENERIVVTQRLGELERRDIIIFKYPLEPSRRFVKRIVGLPGEVLEIRAGKLYVDGNYVDEEYLDPKFNQFPLNKAPLRIPDESYYVLGDNRDNSNDSRFWGPLPREFIEGTLVFHF